MGRLSVNLAQRLFENLIEFSPSLKLVKINYADSNIQDIAQILAYLGNRFAKHSVICSSLLTKREDHDLLNHVPVKIISTWCNLVRVSELRFACEIQYLHVHTRLDDFGNNFSWHSYKTFFQNFSSLKGICMTFKNHGTMLKKDFYTHEIEEKLTANQLQFWR